VYFYLFLLFGFLRRVLYNLFIFLTDFNIHLVIHGLFILFIFVLFQSIHFKFQSIHFIEDPINTFQGIEINEHAERGRRYQARGEEVGQKATFYQIKSSSTGLLENLKQRFPQVLLLDAMQVFDPKAYPADIADLLKHFGEGKTNADGIQFA
jgi:hypothetical protein